MTRLTETDAIRMAADEARRLGFPWNPHRVEARRRRVWPASAFWIVVSRSDEPVCTTTMRVLERARSSIPVRVLYPRTGPREPSPMGGRRLGLVLTAAGGAAVACSVSRWIIGWSWWASTAAAAVWAVIAPTVLFSARIPAASHRPPRRSAGSP